MTLDEQFNAFNEKLNGLLKQHAKLQKENERLKEELRSLQTKDSDNDRRQTELQQRISVLKAAAGTMEDRDKKEFERQINHYLKEVDRCISFLSM